MVSKFFTYLTIFSAVSFAMLLLIPGDPKNAALLGFSALRLLMLAGFLLLVLLLGWGAFYFRKHQERDRFLWGRIESTLRRPYLKQTILFLTSLTILGSIVLILDVFTTTNQFVYQILLRLLPVLVFCTLTGLAILNYPPFKEERRKWLLIILASLLFTLACGLLQEVLLGDLERPYPAVSGPLQAGKWAAMFLSFLWFTWLSRLDSTGRWTWALLGLFITLLLLIQWETYPLVYWPTKHLLAIFIPAAIPLFTLLTMGVFQLWQKLDERWRKTLGFVLQVGTVLLLLVLTIPYYNAAREHARILNDSDRYTDQSNYLEFARQARESNFTYLGEHNQTVGYPFFMAIFYENGMDNESFFERGKQVNIILSLVLIGIMYFLFVRKLGIPAGSLLTLMIAFGLYIFKAPYFQAEILYYFLAFLGFFLMMQMLLKPGFLLAAAAGITLGLAHHTKASVLPALAVFTAVYLLKELLTWIQTYRKESIDRQWLGQTGLRVLYLLIILVSFLAVIYPYIRVTKEKFGAYFYNVNTSVYIWYDDFTEAKAAEEIYNFTDIWPPDMPEEQVPGLRNYLRTHSLAQIIERIKFGIDAQVTNILSQFSVTNYHLTTLFLLILALLADLKNSVSLMRKYPYLVLFACLYFGVYLTSFIWYSPISPERRFTYGLFIPLMFSIFSALRELMNNQISFTGSRSPIRLQAFINGGYFILGLTLIINIWLVLTERIFFDRFGS